MKRYTRKVLVTVGAVALLAACGGSGGDQAGSSSSTSSSSSASSATAAPAVKVTKTALGDVLTDPSGRLLYMFDPDKQGESTCYDQCAQAWPPLQAKGTPGAGAGADASLLGTTTRKDGSKQVTYAKWPLYYFAPDQKPGDVKGQAVGGVWWGGWGDGKGGRGGPGRKVAANE